MVELEQAQDRFVLLVTAATGRKIAEMSRQIGREEQKAEPYALDPSLCDLTSRLPLECQVRRIPQRKTRLLGSSSWRTVRVVSPPLQPLSSRVLPPSLAVSDRRNPRNPSTTTDLAPGCQLLSKTQANTREPPQSRP